MPDIRGRVTDSATGLGVPGIAVSNGELIVPGGEDGAFVLPVLPDGHRFIFVTVPAGFLPGVNFFRTTSDPALFEKGVDFRLTRFERSRSERFTCAHLTDTHYGRADEPAAELDGLRSDFSMLVEDGSPDLAIASGDLTEWGTPEQLRGVVKAFEALPFPWFPLFGGHDGNYERFGGLTPGAIEAMKLKGKRDEILKLIPKEPPHSWTLNFEAVFGPPYYSFDWGRWHFVLFPNEAFHTAADEERKERWLWADLGGQPEGRPIALVVHTLPSPEFLTRLEEAGVRLVLHGHWHSSKVIRYGELTVAAAPPLCFGGIDTSPRGYYRIMFDGDAWQMERRVLYANPEPAKPTSDPRLRWRVQLPGFMHRAAPVRCGNRILAAVQDPAHPGKSGVVCLEDRTGETAWRLETDNAVANRVAIDDSGAMGAATTLSGRVYAFETASGSVVWTADLPGYPFRWLYPAPVIAGDTVIAGGKAGYGAWNLRTGDSIWYRSLGPADKWPSYAGPAAWDSLLILPTSEGLEAVDARNGEPVWRRRMRIDYPYASPVVSNDRVVHGGDWVDLHGPVQEPAGLVVLDAATGQDRWDRKVLEASYPTGMAVQEDTIFVTTPHGQVQTYDARSSELRWRHTTGENLLDAVPYRRAGSSLLADPVVIENALHVGGCDGVVVVLDTNSGRVRHSFVLGAAVTAPVCALDNGFCVGTFNGQIYCFD